MLLCLIMAFAFIVSGCAKEVVEPADSTVTTDSTTPSTDAPTAETVETEPVKTSEELREELKAAVKSAAENGADIKEVLQEVIDSGIISPNCIIEDVNDGFIDGFMEPITGFTEGAVATPLFEKVPFIACLLKADDAEALKEEMMAKIDEVEFAEFTDILISEVYGDYVLFAIIQ